MFPLPCLLSLFKNKREKKKKWCLSFIYHCISSGNKRQNNKRSDEKNNKKKAKTATWWRWRERAVGERNGLNQYHESTGIWNGAKGQFRSSISAADCASHPRGKASQGCSTTALNKSIVLHFVCVFVCVVVVVGGGLCVLSATSPTHNDREGQVKCWVRKLCKQGCYWSGGVNKCCSWGPEADVKLNCFTGWDFFFPSFVSFLLYYTVIKH